MEKGMQSVIWNNLATSHSYFKSEQWFSATLQRSRPASVLQQNNMS